jgi:hypothetical protein
LLSAASSCEEAPQEEEEEPMNSKSWKALAVEVAKKDAKLAEVYLAADRLVYRTEGARRKDRTPATEKAVKDATLARSALRVKLAKLAEKNVTPKAPKAPTTEPGIPVEAFGAKAATPGPKKPGSKAKTSRAALRDAAAEAAA